MMSKLTLPILFAKCQQIRVPPVSQSTRDRRYSTLPALRPRLEVYPESELHHPWIARERGDLRRRPGTDTAARRGKQRMIENVKDLPTELGPQDARLLVGILVG
jgi:hypothetical protein